MSSGNPTMIFSWKLAPAWRALARHGVIGYPTEAVYGLGCLPEREPVARLLRMKRRSPRKGLILIAANPAQLSDYVDFSDDRIDFSQISSTWPGPVTWLLPARPGLPKWLIGDHIRLAVRVSDHPLVQALCVRTGALVSTSANPAGSPPARDAARVRAYFGGQLDYVLSGRLGKQQKPTEIRDAVSGEIVRQGDTQENS